MTSILFNCCFQPEKVKSPRELELEDLHEKVRQLEKNLSEEKKLRIELQALLKYELYFSRIS